MSRASTIADSGISDWRPSQLADLSGKTYVITGGNSGIGLEAAKHLATKNADIIIACRNTDKAKAAVGDISELGKGTVSSIKLNLADLVSVRKAAGKLAKDTPKIDALINNAGVMQTPQQKTADGFEMQIGTNHLGHFLWTGLMLPNVEAAKGRIVTVSSIAHKFGKIHLDNLMLKDRYDPTRAYTQSKLANLSFALELDRRLEAAGSETISIACHPGYSDTNLQSTGPAALLNLLYIPMNMFLAQSAKKGAYPTVLAAAGTQAKRGAYYGPTGFMDTRGPVSDAEVMPRALNEQVAEKLWDLSEELVDFEWKLKG